MNDQPTSTTPTSFADAPAPANAEAEASPAIAASPVAIDTPSETVLRLAEDVPAASATDAPAETILRLTDAPLAASAIATPAPTISSPVVQPAADPAPTPAAPAPSPSMLASWRERLASLRPPELGWRHAAYAGALLLGIGGATLFDAANRSAARTEAARTAKLDARLDRLSDDISTLRDAIAGLPRTARTRDETKPIQDRIASLSETLDRFRLDNGAKIVALAGAVERMEKADREANGRIGQIGERIERIERQTAAAAAPVTTGSIASAQSIPTPPARPDAPANDKSGVTAIEQKTKPVEGWALRDIYGGMALIENRRTGLLEVSPGQTVRGLGRIEKIERRGRQWVVVTEQGVIASN